MDKKSFPHSQDEQKGKCPMCRKPRVQEFRPFCSKRCADLDLGRWFTGRYVVPGESEEESEENPNLPFAGMTDKNPKK